MENEEHILNNYRRVALIGASPNPETTSYMVVDYLLRHGFHLIPINPKCNSILGYRCYPDLISVPEKIEIVDVFKDPAKLTPVVNESILVNAKAVWFEEGIINYEAARVATDAGLFVVMNKSIIKEHQRLGL